MKLHKRYWSLLFIVMFASPLWAQQDPIYSQYMFNGILINPAYAGSKKIYLLDYYTENNGFKLKMPQLLSLFRVLHGCGIKKNPDY